MTPLKNYRREDKESQEKNEPQKKHYCTDCLSCLRCSDNKCNICLQTKTKNKPITDVTHESKNCTLQDNNIPTFIMKRKKAMMMTRTIPDRTEAYSLLTKYNKNESLIRHALAVEAVMLHFSELLGEKDPQKWAIIGLIHDLDYEMFPEQHCKKIREILTMEEWPEEYIRAAESHGWGICSEVEPVAKMEKVLYTIDELTGLIAASALVRPSKSILDMNVKSVKKKWKDKSFAAGVNRQIIEEGAKNLGMDLDQVIEEVMKGMQKVAESIGLKGDLEQA